MSREHLMLRHTQAFFASLGRLVKNPLANFMTIAVIAIALALPAGLYVLLENMQGVSSNWNNSAQISMYLKTGITDAQAQEIVSQLQGDKQIDAVSYISPAEGMREFEKRSGFADVLSQLKDNPLPGVIQVRPVLSEQAPFMVDQLVQRLKQLPQVEAVQLDLEWIKRLYALVSIAKRMVWALGSLFAIAVLLIIGNTLRLAIQHHRAEIEVIKLIGGTAAFIRRPFLYTGMLYGLCGGVGACLLVNGILSWLNAPIAHLVGLYQSSLHLTGLNSDSALTVISIGIFLGLLGAWLSVTRQLQTIEAE